jgi:hypothetical protein
MEIENLILEHLRVIRGKLDRLESGQKDIADQIASLRLREYARDGDDLRRDRMIAELQAEMERVRRRLDLVDETSG